MNLGDHVDVYDGDLDAWVPCRLESIGHVDSMGEVRIFRPIDDTVRVMWATRRVHRGWEGRRTIYGVPWPEGERLTRKGRL